MKLYQAIDNINSTLFQGNQNFYSNQNLLIVGKNTAGKSKLISDVIQYHLKNKNYSIYFIDSKNRKITSTNTSQMDQAHTFSYYNGKVKDILMDRIDKKFFNKEDIFSTTDGTEILQSELLQNQAKYIKLLDQVLGMSLEFVGDCVPGSDNYIIHVNKNELDALSDAQNAMIRILMEVNFASEQNCKTVLIDEFDVHLDHVNCSIFINKIMETYPNLHFILAVHSPYTILGVENYDILHIRANYDNVDDNECIFYESNDMDDINIINKKLYYIEDRLNEKDIMLSNALSQVVKERKIDRELMTKLEREKDKFTVRQNVVYRNIMQLSRRIE